MLHMRLLFCFLVCCGSIVARAQSPFNYGQNEEVYFISASQREDWKINIVIAHDTEQLELFTFEEKKLAYQWFPSAYQGTPAAWLDSLGEPLNGTDFEWNDNGKFTLITGWGYGSFDHYEFMQRDGRCFVALDCVGHCGDHPTAYSEILFDEQGLPVADIRFIPQDAEMDVLSLDDDSITLETFIASFQAEQADTTFIYY
jgi:hypothetical protein